MITFITSSNYRKIWCHILDALGSVSNGNVPSGMTVDRHRNYKDSWFVRSFSNIRSRSFTARSVDTTSWRSFNDVSWNSSNELIFIPRSFQTCKFLYQDRLVLVCHEKETRCSIDWKICLIKNAPSFKTYISNPSCVDWRRISLYEPKFDAHWGVSSFFMYQSRSTGETIEPNPREVSCGCSLLWPYSQEIIISNRPLHILAHKHIHNLNIYSSLHTFDN